MNFNPMDLLKNPQAIKEQVAIMQEQLKDVTATGSSGGNIVRVTLNGQLELIALELDPITVDPRDISMLQDLIIAAHHDAQQKIQEAIRQKLGPALSGFMPGLGG
jgi:DNA-binding YbaB/EbfC family protein